jgi:dihydrofolate reductase
MSKLIVWNIMSLDGYFEGREPWDLATHELVWGEELEQFSKDQLREASVILFGRATYEGWRHTGRRLRARLPMG